MLTTTKAKLARGFVFVVLMRGNQTRSTQHTRNSLVSISDYISMEGSLIEGLFTQTRVSSFIFNLGFLGYHRKTSVEDEKHFFLHFFPRKNVFSVIEVLIIQIILKY